MPLRLPHSDPRSAFAFPNEPPVLTRRASRAPAPETMGAPPEVQDASNAVSITLPEEHKGESVGSDYA